VLWVELERDFPEAYRIYTRELGRLLKQASLELRGQLRKDVHPVLAMSLLIAAIRHAADTGLCKRLGLSRREAVRRAIDQWARGAVAR
jgi:hypothetical protein